MISFPTIGNLPVHRTNIIHSDPQGDVPDADFDIVQVASCIESPYIVLELTVTGVIQTADTESPYSDFLYRISVIAKGINRDTHQYDCVYQGVGLRSYDFAVEVENSTLRVFFPLSFFLPDSYMIGLEGCAFTPFDDDLTPEDRNSNIARLLF